MCNDIDLDHPEVVEELKHWGKWVTGALNIDGMFTGILCRRLVQAACLRTHPADEGRLSLRVLW